MNVSSDLNSHMSPQKKKQQPTFAEINIIFPNFPLNTKYLPSGETSKYIIQYSSVPRESINHRL